MSPCPSVLLWVTLECRVAEASTVNGSRHSSLLFDDTQRDQEPTIGTQVDPLAQFDRPSGRFRSPDGMDCLVTVCAGGSGRSRTGIHRSWREHVVNILFSSIRKHNTVTCPRSAVVRRWDDRGANNRLITTSPRGDRRGVRFDLRGAIPAPIRGRLPAGAVSGEWSPWYREFGCPSKTGWPAVAERDSGPPDVHREWLLRGEGAMLLRSTGTERVYSHGFRPRWADIAGDIRYLLVRASRGHRSCLGFEGRCGEVTR